MELFLCPEDPRSLAVQIYDQIRADVADGRLRPGSRLPPTRMVAAELGVARSTVTDAYARLGAEGFIAGRRGGGTVVVGGVGPSRPGREPPATLGPTPHAASIPRYGEGPARRSPYDLTAGRVDAGLFPTAVWRRCVHRGLASTDQATGHYAHPVGSDDLRRALAGWVGQSRGVAASPAQIVVTQGTGQAVDLVARVVLRPGDVAAVEEPGYPPVTSVLLSQGVEVVGVPVDEHGLVVDALPAEAKLVHVTPSHQYPLGAVLSHDRRRSLLTWAGRHNAAVLEDDYDSEFRHEVRPLEPLHRLDREGLVVYVGSFSKTLSPSLRVGFMVAPRGLVPALTAVRQAVDGGPPAVIDAALTTFVGEGHLARHVRRARKVYLDRYRTVWRELTRLPGVRPLPTHAGLHVAVLAPDAPSDDQLRERADRRDVLISTLRRTYQFTEPRAGAVVGFGAVATSHVPEAVHRLGECLS